MGLFGSRTVRIGSEVSTEIYRVNKLPEDRSRVTPLAVSRWLQLHVPEGFRSFEKTHPAEPLFLCARSNEWRLANIEGRLSVEFLQADMRTRDMTAVRILLSLHLGVMVLISSPASIPYLAAIGACWTVYHRGLHHFILIVLLSSFIVLLTPLMLLRKNRIAIYHYILVNFGKSHLSDTEKILREKLPLFQAMYLASVVVCLGSALAVGCFKYLGVDRESRNTLIKLTLGLAASLLTFFVCQSLDRFCSQWSWLLLAVGLAKTLERHLNPMSRDKALIVSIILSFILKLTLPFILKAVGIGRFIRFLNSTWLRLGLSALLQRLRRRKQTPPAIQVENEEKYDGFFETGDLELVDDDELQAIASDLGLSEEEQLASHTLDSCPSLSKRPSFESSLGISELMRRIRSSSEVQSLSLVDENPEVEMVSDVINLPILVVGPIHIDGLTSWLPLATDDPDVGGMAQRACELISACNQMESLLSFEVTCAVEALVSVKSSGAALRLSHWLSTETTLESIDVLIQNQDSHLKSIDLKCKPIGSSCFLRLQFFCGSNSSEKKDPGFYNNHGNFLLEKVLFLIRNQEGFEDVKVIRLGNECDTVYGGQLSILTTLSEETLLEWGISSLTLIETNDSIQNIQMASNQFTPHQKSYVMRQHIKVRNAVLLALGFEEISSEEEFIRVTMTPIDNAVDTEITSKLFVPRSLGKSKSSRQHDLCANLMAGVLQRTEYDFGLSRVLLAVALGQYLSICKETIQNIKSNDKME